jgi:hypothetical protein
MLTVLTEAGYVAISHIAPTDFTDIDDIEQWFQSIGMMVEKHNVQ